MKRWMPVLLALLLAGGLGADEIRFGPRVSGGWSKDVDFDSAAWSPEPIYSVGLQAEWDRDDALWAAFEVAYDQASLGVSQTVFGGPYSGQVAHAWLTEDQVAEAVLGGLRGSWWSDRLRPRAYLGLQFTQALDLKTSTSLAGQNYEQTDYFNQDHRYRSLGLAGLGLGLGRGDAVVLDLRLSQELWRQTGWAFNHLFAKWQLGVTWFYSLPLR